MIPLYKSIHTNEVISKTSLLSFPQVKRVGNPSETKERFRTSRNDSMMILCGFANGRLDIKERKDNADVTRK